MSREVEGPHRAKAEDPLLLSQIIEGVEARSAASFYRLAGPDISEKLGISVETIGGAVALAARKSRHRYFNRVVGLGLFEPASPRILDRVHSFYVERGISKYSIPLSPYARPTSLQKRLLRRGFFVADGDAKLSRAGEAVVKQAGPFKIRPIGAEHADEWLDVFAAIFTDFRSRTNWFRARFGQSGWTHHAAFDRGRIVAIGALYVERGAGHLLEGATLKPYRRRGLQRRMIEERIADGFGRGARWFTSETAPPTPRAPLVSFRNLGRAGFDLAYLRPSMVFDEATRKRLAEG